MYRAEGIYLIYICFPSRHTKGIVLTFDKINTILHPISSTFIIVVILYNTLLQNMFKSYPFLVLE